MVQKNRILIVSVNWLGDLLFMTPAIRAIRSRYPHSRIVCLAPERGIELLRTNPHLNEVIPYRESRGLCGFFRWIGIAARLKKEKFDAVFLFHRSFTRAMAAWLAGIPCRIGYRRKKQGWLLTQSIDPPDKDSIHKAAWYMKLLEVDGIRSDDLSYDIGLEQTDFTEADRLLKHLGIDSSRKIVALHPGANWVLKRWPVGEFARLADEIQEKTQAAVLFIGGEGDLPLVEKVAGRMRSRPFVATGKTTLKQTGALLTRVSVLISNDSGPLHLGAAVGTPVVGLFGPTLPHVSGPPSGSNAVSLFGSIGCPVPCYQLKCPANLCMSEIKVEQVLAAAEPYLR
ncbi:MAG: lipopolysaccharide heptosyltransferase II [Candidatus Omnitrophica bacterium]|nr:lipopolysaccharide heptosyltransferase II [Candidatus Omnitrophota bacterium]